MEQTKISYTPKRKVKYTSDWTLWACYIVLCAVSIVEVFSASSLELKNGSVYLPITSHMQWLAIGFVLMFGMEHLHYKYTKLIMPLIATASIILAIITPIFGTNTNAAVRSITIMGISVQAAEPCKLACAMMLAYFLSRFQKSDGTGLSTKGIWIGLGIILTFVGLLITQGGSNALLILLVGGTMMILSVLPRKLILSGLAILVVAIGGVVALVVSDSKKQDTPAQSTELVAQDDESDSKESSFGRSNIWVKRIKNWLPDSVPEYEKPTTYGYDSNSQEHHAYMAIAHGNGIGVFPGNSRECSRLQLAFSDYIYAIILEELGLLGGLVVLLCYLGIIIRACMISKKCKSAYASLLIMGMALIIVYQAFYHMCISVGVLPVSGQPLPFISKGGTSIAIMSFAMGMMLSVSRFAVERSDAGLKTIDDDDELPDDLKAENPAAGF